MRVPAAPLGKKHTADQFISFASAHFKKTKNFDCRNAASGDSRNRVPWTILIKNGIFYNLALVCDEE